MDGFNGKMRTLTIAIVNLNQKYSIKERKGKSKNDLKKKR